MRLFGLMALLLLVACAREPVWHKAGGGKAVFEQDSTACFRGASARAQAQLGNQGAAAAPQIELRSS